MVGICGHHKNVTIIKMHNKKTGVVAKNHKDNADIFCRINEKEIFNQVKDVLHNPTIVYTTPRLEVKENPFSSTPTTKYNNQSKNKVLKFSRMTKFPPRA